MTNYIAHATTLALVLLGCTAPLPEYPVALPPSPDDRAVALDARCSEGWQAAGVVLDSRSSPTQCMRLWQRYQCLDAPPWVVVHSLYESLDCGEMLSDKNDAPPADEAADNPR